MSNLVTALCQTRKFGSAPLKAVAMYMADRASDDGSGIWTSKSHIAQDTELSKRTVQNSIKELVAAGLVIEVGKRRHQHGHTVEYSVCISAVKSLPSTREKDASETGAGGARVQEVHPTGAGHSPHGVQEVHPNHPITTQEPSKGAADLFSSDETDQQAPPVDDLDEKAQAFWDEYPKCPRKANRKGVMDRFKAIVLGKYKKVDQASADRILAGLRGFIASKPDEQYIKAPLAWLNDARWEAFDAPQPPNPNGPRSSFMQKSGW